MPSPLSLFQIPDRAKSLNASQSEPPGTIPAAEADAGVKPSAQSPPYNVPTGNRGRSDCEHDPHLDQSSGFDASFRLSTARRLSEFVARSILLIERPPVDVAYGDPHTSFIPVF